MLAHLEHCDDCREVVATVVQAQGHLAEVPTISPVPITDDASPALVEQAGARQWRSYWPWALAAAATAVLAVRFIGPPAPQLDPAAESDLATLTRAAGRERTIEGRLSLLADHLPLASPTRRAELAQTRFEPQAVAAQLAEAPDLGSPEAGRRLRAQHVAAVAALLAGQADQAAAALEAALESTDDRRVQSRLLTDLSAARGALGEWSGALEAAQQALERDSPNPAGRFNLALALERLGRRDEATRAWTVIADDTAEAAGWRDEARRHLKLPVP
jgi:tetratricopeptide (TPR) repeat protein